MFHPVNLNLLNDTTPIPQEKPNPMLPPLGSMMISYFPIFQLHMTTGKDVYLQIKTSDILPNNQDKMFLTICDYWAKQDKISEDMLSLIQDLLKVINNNQCYHSYNQEFHDYESFFNSLGSGPLTHALPDVKEKVFGCQFLAK